MFIERLIINSKKGVLRDIVFSEGLNLIVDETPNDNRQQTGNNVGKTTVLKLIDFCLGGTEKEIYQDPENKKAVYETVRDYLEKQAVEVILILVDTLVGVPQQRTEIRRNFLKGKDAIREIDGQQVKAKDFIPVLASKILPQLPPEGKPTFRQVISHNIRYSELSLTHTLRTLSNFTRDVEYEALYLFMLGCLPEDGSEKQRLVEKHKTEKRYIRRLENGWSMQDYEVARNLIEEKLASCEEKLSGANSNVDVAAKFEKASKLKTEINQLGASLTEIELRIAIIEEAEADLLSKRSSIDSEKLKYLYSEVKSFIPDLQKSFEDLTRYHNAMIVERVRFITEELPELRESRDILKSKLAVLANEDNMLNKQLSEIVNDADYGALLEEQNTLYHRKGEYDARIDQLQSAYEKLYDIEKALKRIEEDAQAGGVDRLLKKQLAIFNRHLSKVSTKLYGEIYALNYETIEDRSGTPVRRFYFIDASNISSGKKQGEMLCFDIAYTSFADEEGIDCLHFLLNDKKELMHGNQLAELSQVALSNNTQIIIPILSDKVPPSMMHDGAVVLTLSQNEKLLKIEENL